jgi:hypothetical protein
VTAGLGSRRSLVVGGLLLLAAAAVAVLVLRGGDENAVTPPTTTTALLPVESAAELPAVDAGEASSTAAFLDGEGARLLVVHDAAVDVAGDLDESTCAETVSDLDERAPVDEIVALLARVSDEPLRAALESERQALGLLLTACVRGDEEVTTDERVATLLEVAGLVEGRLADVEAAT